MCKPESLGGQLCPEHTREPYRLALAIYSQRGKPINSSEANSLLEVTTRYASTMEGENKIKLDLMRNPSREDIAITLEMALKKGKRLREVNAETAWAINQASGNPTNKSSFDGTAPEPISWLIDAPIWPNKSTTDKATLGLGKNKEETALIQKAFRALYRDAWRTLFLGTSKISHSPKSNQEGWAWRNEATEFASKRIAKATIISSKDVVIGMTVYNGFGIYTVKDVKTVPLGLAKKQIISYKFSYYNFTGKEESSAERKFALLVPGKPFTSAH